MFVTSNLKKKLGELFLSNEMVLWLAYCVLLEWIYAGGKKEEREKKKRREEGERERKKNKRSSKENERKKN